MGLFTLFLRRADIFGVQITFVGLNRLKYQTKMGGIVSLLMIGWLMYNVVLQFINLVEQEIKLVTTSADFSQVPPSMNVNNFNLMFALQIDQKGFIDVLIRNNQNPYFTFQLQTVSITNYTQVNVTKISLKPCTLANFNQLYFYNAAMENVLQLNNISNWVCPDFDQIINLQGDADSMQFTQMNIVATYCNSSIQDYTYTCPSTTQTEQFLQKNNYQIKINMMMSNLNVNSGSTSSSPYTGFIDTGYYTIVNPIQQFVQADLFLKNYALNTTSSLITSTYTTQNYIVHEDSDVVEKFLIKQVPNSLIYQMFIKSSQYSYSTARSQVSLSDFLAYIGGIFSSLYAVANVVMSLYAYQQLWLKLFKVFYNLIDQDYECKTIQDIVDIKFSQSNMQTPRLKSFIMFCLRSARQNIEMYFESQDIILEDLSIVTYLRLIKDVQKLKSIIFSPRQQDILRLYAKDTVVLKGIKEMHSHKLEQGKKFLYGKEFQQRTLKEYEKIIHHYNELVQDTDDKFQKYITQRMICIFDKDLQSIILNTKDQEYLRFENTSPTVRSYRGSKCIVDELPYIIKTKEIQISKSEVESLLKTLFFKESNLKWDEFDLKYERESYYDTYNYLIQITNNFVQFNMQIDQQQLILEQSYNSKKHKLVCQKIENSQLSIELLISQSVKLKIDNRIFLLLCNTYNISFLGSIQQVPPGFDTKLYIHLQNSGNMSALSKSFHKQLFKVDRAQLIFIFHDDSIELLLNYPNSTMVLNDMISRNYPMLQLFQCVHDLFDLYLKL